MTTYTPETLRRLEHYYSLRPGLYDFGPRTQEGWVYYISSGRFVKIGSALNPLTRIRILQNGSALPLSLLLIEPDFKGRTQERVRHRQFRPFRKHGEWFGYEGRLQTFIEEGMSRTRSILGY